MSLFDRIWDWLAGMVRRFVAWLEDRDTSDASDAATPLEGGQVIAAPQFNLQNAVEPTYEKRRTILTNPEATLFETLGKIVGNSHQVFPAVRLAEVINLQNLPANKKYHKNQILCKHFDFVICHLTSFEPLLAVELNDATHTLFDRRKSDDFKRRVCKEIGLPLVEIVVGERMTDERLRQIVLDHLNSPVTRPQHKHNER